MKFPSSIRLFILTAAIAQARSDDSSVSSVIKEKFDEWMSKYNKVYSAKEELEHRFAIWKDTDKIIEEHNSQDPTPTFSLGHNSYSDLTLGEFHEHFSLGAYHPNSEVPQVDLDLIDVHDHPAVAINAAVGGIQESAIARKVEELPDAVDWVADGAVTTVKDQGSCGSCWAFSSVGAVEGAKAIYDGELVDLSPQNVMDCDRHLIDNGCNGGNMMTAFHFVKRNVGICTEVDYPYEAENNDECGSESCLNVGGSDISGYTAVELYSPSALMTALVRQPAAVAIDASSVSWVCAMIVYDFYLIWYRLELIHPVLTNTYIDEYYLICIN